MNIKYSNRIKFVQIANRQTNKMKKNLQIKSIKGIDERN